MHITSQDIQDMDKRRRAAFINSLSGYKPANLIGTADAAGNTNLAIMSSVVHLGSHPPLLALVIRPGGEERHTLANILATGHYSINHVSAHMVEAAHQTAARYHRDVSEFDATGLTPKWRDGFPAPLVAEAEISMGMALREHQHLAINETHLVIGEINFVEIPEHCLREDGAIDLASADTVVLAGLDTYFDTSAIKRMAYAKPDLPPRVIPD
ncbi:flavin reductase family protein [Mangrovimicrobium sediminis]|uniref:Flavin reductase family protein n=1 Tax=Mangrovimicrobium sediminis TaxID=2562682 RepID=A0A4Z0LY73_9GAMM|nr:flavin reductase family protein [Haliea sp. SAOS-164]TGD72231.1 flavin reductase family protein [Haliea sp. SAOS-164]